MMSGRETAGVCHVAWWCSDGVIVIILRRFAILVLGLLPLLAHSAFSQTEVKAHRVGLLSAGGPFTDTSEVVVGLTAGFSKRGYVIGRSLRFERRAAEAHVDRLPRLVDDLKSEAELIITNAYAAARVVKDRSNVPVVAITGADPVATGLIDSLARPGGKNHRHRRSRSRAFGQAARGPQRYVSGLAKDCHVVERRRSWDDRTLQKCRSGGADTGFRDTAARRV